VRKEISRPEKRFRPKTKGRRRQPEVRGLFQKNHHEKPRSSSRPSLKKQKENGRISKERRGSPGGAVEETTKTRGSIEGKKDNVKFPDGSNLFNFRRRSSPQKKGKSRKKTQCRETD